MKILANYQNEILKTDFKTLWMRVDDCKHGIICYMQGFSQECIFKDNNITSIHIRDQLSRKYQNQRL